MIGDGNKVKGLVRRPSSYDSDVTPTQNAVSWLSTRVLDYLKDWKAGVTNYQICLELEDGKVISTKVTKALMDRYVSDEALSPQEKDSIKQFLALATDSDLSGLSQGELKTLAGLLSTTKNLESVRQLLALKLRNFEFIGRHLSKNNEILSMVLNCGYPDKREVLKLFGMHPELLKLDIQFLDRILKMPAAYELLFWVTQFPEVMLKPDLMEKIFRLPNITIPLESWEISYTLRTIGETYKILQLMKPELVDKIFLLRKFELAHILKWVSRYPGVIELKPDFMEKIYRLPAFSVASPDWNLIYAVGENYKILQLMKPELMDKIFLLPDAAGILKAIGKNSQILELIKPELMDKIFLLPDADGILNAIGKNPKILELLEELKSELIDKILPLPNAGGILEAIDKNSKILELLELKPDFVIKVLPLPNAGKVLSIIAEHPEILELMKPDLIYKIIISPNSDKIFSAIAANPEILEFKPELMDRMLFGPNSSGILNILEMYSKDLMETDILIIYEEIYERLNGKVGNNFESIVFPYLIRRSEQLASKSPGPFLNYSQFLNDVMFAKCKLPIRERDVSDAEWKVLRQDLEAKVQAFFPGDEHKQKLLDALRWFDQMPNTRDAQLGLQVIRKRVASIVDYIKKQEVDPKVLGSDALVDEGIEIAKELVRILAEGGSGRRCPDAAAMALEEAEIFAMAFTKKPNSTLGYIMNVIVNDYKRNIIPAKFVDPKKFESVETQLYHLTLLNKPLGLESQTGSMLHEGIAIQTPLDVAMKVSYGEFSEEGLIGFAQDHPLMQALFRTDPKALEEFDKLMHDPDHGLYTVMHYQGKEQIVELYADEDPERYIKNLQYLMAHAPSVDALKKLKEFIEISGNLDEIYRDPEKAEKAKILSDLYNKLDKMIDNFKAEKTKMLLKQEGFLTDTAEYADPADAYFQQV